MVYLCYVWLCLAFAIFLGYIVVSSRKLRTNFILNLYIFGKLRNSEEYNLTSNFLQVPKRWFFHFYAAGLVVHTPVLLVMVHSVFIADEFPKEVSLILSYVRIPASRAELLPPVQIILVLLMGEIQMIRRLIESIYINSYSPSTMSIIIYLTGIIFYCLQGVSVVSVMQEKSLRFGAVWNDLQWYNYLLIFMFIYSSYKQHALNNILASLRRNKQGSVVTDKHLMPVGDLFNHCSCPHFFMEILIYSVYCAMFWWRHSVCNAIWLFVFVNQTLAGHFAHSWYQATFPNYPKDRAPVIPFLHYDRLNSSHSRKKL
ncbi:polyprenol reductase-like [Ostrea edulis]|uniref:polyprenol reductase-like n=1 Tax=Ostrea edulis TaxID=37623 RepID=UPI0024AF2E79|nr:polyprenol reductase-like [Ostrea edulis]